MRIDRGIFRKAFRKQIDARGPLFAVKKKADNNLTSHVSPICAHQYSAVRVLFFPCFFSFFLPTHDKGVFFTEPKNFSLGVARAFRDFLPRGKRVRATVRDTAFRFYQFLASVSENKGIFHPEKGATRIQSTRNGNF